MLGKWWPTRTALTSKNGLAVALGLALTGCPTGPSLDTPYEEYVPEPSGIDSSTLTSSTTTGSAPCDDSNVNEALLRWCSGTPCHGTLGQDNGKAPLWLFSPTRSSDFLNQAAVTEGCSAELIIDTANPEASLLLTSLRSTSPCGVEMPQVGAIDVPAEQACIEEWVLSLAGGY